MSVPAERRAKGDDAIRATFERAQRLHRDGFTSGSDAKMREAGRVYETILERVPGHADAMHFLGVLSHQRGESERAVALISAAIERAPDAAAMHNNLGNVLRELGRLEPARRSYVTAVLLAPGDADALTNLGTVLRSLGRVTEAERTLRRATEIAPRSAIAHYNLGNALVQQARWDEGIAAFSRALAIDAKHTDSRRRLGLALHAAGRADEAREVFEAWSRAEPTNPVPSHTLAGLLGVNVPARAADAFVKHSFDRMAGWFDTHLASLDYRAPALAAAAVTAHVTRDSLDVLDAGCGTGLCAPFLRPRARVLTGVDLSPAMLAKARSRKLYDALHEAELTAFLQRDTHAYDLVVATDTVIYFGEITELFAAAATALRPEGWFVFTVEHTAGASDDGTYTLHPHGRYSHAEGYVRRALASTGFEVVALGHETLRTESKVPVAGLVVSARRAA